MTASSRPGDRGITCLANNERVPKDDLRIEVCGSIDELSAVLGLVRAENIPAVLNGIIFRIQNELIAAGTEVAEYNTADKISAGHVKQLETEIEQLKKPLGEKPFRFSIPGSTKISALLHFARTVCRRTERRLTAFYRIGGEKTAENSELLPYFNRLSGILFFLAVDSG
ncbi:MAG: cob(I)yrinic acid a,c-diamide adenosyltransferase [Planctomycetaceae bacterium]|jgi:cob(I)alamin adenosyltransferase|nr:cob(I)yrinic acid a,c-diamide adenosyltransferase [Planctomycetaceae bacterium]